MHYKDNADTWSVRIPFAIVTWPGMAILVSFFMITVVSLIMGESSDPNGYMGTGMLYVFATAVPSIFLFFYYWLLSVIKRKSEFLFCP